MPNWQQGRPSSFCQTRSARHRIVVLLDSSGAVLGEPAAAEWVAANAIAFHVAQAPLPNTSLALSFFLATRSTSEFLRINYEPVVVSQPAARFRIDKRLDNALRFPPSCGGLPRIPVAKRFHLLVEPGFLHLRLNFRTREAPAKRFGAVGEAPRRERGEHSMQL